MMRSWVASLVVVMGCVGSWCKADQVAFPTFGVSVDAPEGLFIIPPASMGQVARWARVNPMGQVTAIVALEVQPANGRSVEDWARGSGGVTTAIASDASKMGVEDATHFRNAAKSSDIHLVDAYVAKHGAFLWIVSSYASADPLDANIVDNLRRSVNFTAPASPSGHLEFYRDAMPVFGDIRARMPVICRPMPSQDKAQAQIGVWSYAKNRCELSVVFDSFDRGLEPDPDVTLAKWAKSLGKKYRLDPPPRWHRLEGTADKVIVEPIRVKAEGTDASVRIINGLAQVGKQKTVLITCTVMADTQAEHNAYQVVVEQILASITAGGAR